LRIKRLLNYILTLPNRVYVAYAEDSVVLSAVVTSSLQITT